MFGPLVPSGEKIRSSTVDNGNLSDRHSSALAVRDGETIRERGKEKGSLSVDIENSFFFPLFFLIFKF